MKEVLSNNVVDNDLLDNNIDYIVNVINDKTLRNQIQIEILAKNLKKKSKDVKLRIESELITTIIEENHKLNRVKKTTIRTKLMPKINNAQSESVSEKIVGTKTKKEKRVATSSPIRSNNNRDSVVTEHEEGQLIRTGSSDSGLSDNCSISKSKNDIKKSDESDLNEQCELLKKHNAILNKNSKKKRMVTGGDKSITSQMNELEKSRSNHDSSSEEKDEESDLSTSSAPAHKATSFVLDTIKRINKLSGSEAKENKPVKRIKTNGEFVKTKESVKELTRSRICAEPTSLTELDTNNTVQKSNTALTSFTKYQPSSMLKTLNFLLRDKYKKNFELNDSELDTIFSFYNQNKTGTSLDITDLEKFLIMSSMHRIEVKATRADIKTALIAVDSDHDSKISLDEFLHLLVLFFADKSNLKQRLVSVLRNQSIFHRRMGWLTTIESTEFIEFCFRFYGRLMKITDTLKQDIEYDCLGTQLASALEPHLYVSDTDMKL